MKIFQWLLYLFPKAHRDAATLLYSFARDADDIADEGKLTKKQKKSC